MGIKPAIDPNNPSSERYSHEQLQTLLQQRSISPSFKATPLSFSRIAKKNIGASMTNLPNPFDSRPSVLQRHRQLKAIKAKHSKNSSMSSHFSPFMASSGAKLVSPRYNNLSDLRVPPSDSPPNQKHRPLNEVLNGLLNSDDKVGMAENGDWQNLPHQSTVSTVVMGNNDGKTMNVNPLVHQQQEDNIRIDEANCLLQ